MEAYRPGSFTAPEAFVIPLHLLGVIRRHRLAIERNDGGGRLTAKKFLGDLVAQFHERAVDRVADRVPVGRHGVAAVIVTHGLGALANLGRALAKCRIVDGFLDAADAIGPYAVPAAGKGAPREIAPYIAALPDIARVARPVGKLGRDACRIVRLRGRCHTILARLRGSCCQLIARLGRGIEVARLGPCAIQGELIAGLEITILWEIAAELSAARVVSGELTTALSGLPTALSRLTAALAALPAALPALCNLALPAIALLAILWPILILLITGLLTARELLVIVLILLIAGLLSWLLSAPSSALLPAALAARQCPATLTTAALLPRLLAIALLPLSILALLIARLLPARKLLIIPRLRAGATRLPAGLTAPLPIG